MDIEVSANTELIECPEGCEHDDNCMCLLAIEYSIGGVPTGEVILVLFSDMLGN